MGDVVDLHPGPQPATIHEGCPIIISVEETRRHQAVVQDGTVRVHTIPLDAPISVLEGWCVIHNVEIDLEQLQWT